MYPLPHIPEPILPREPAPIVRRQCVAPQLPIYPSYVPQLPPRPLIRPVMHAFYEAMQRGEFVPAVIFDHSGSEPPELPVDGSSGRRRKRYEEEDEDNEDSDEEGRHAKRSRVSWGPLDFLRPWV
ncbi:hypothetical protein B0H19DRAFT_1258010 [Mycena capillaripes]|nr:hypothetical protein B0H19DRAFT_1258010 [Mycena capillaripes]